MIKSRHFVDVNSIQLSKKRKTSLVVKTSISFEFTEFVGRFKIPHTPKSFGRIYTGCRRKLNRWTLTSSHEFEWSAHSIRYLKAIKHDNLRHIQNMFFLATNVNAKREKKTRSTSA